MKLQDLAMSLHDWFKCVDGPPKAYFEMQDGKILKDDQMPNSQTPLTHHVYQTIKLAATTFDADDRILQELWRRFNSFRKTLEGRPTLVWRMHPGIETTDEEILGPLWATWEEWCDRGKPKPPEGVVQPWDTMNLFYLEGHRSVTQCSMRLAIIPKPDYSLLQPVGQGQVCPRI